MKELSIEEKARAYDEAIDKTKKELDACGSQDCDAARQIFRLFSELKESEDEKTWIINYLSNRIFNSTIIAEKENLKKAIAWLEKQGGQKPVELPNGDDYGIDGLWHAQRILEKTLGKVEGYQSDDGILEHKCAISAIKNLYEQKPTWSEEDERMLGKCLDAASGYYSPEDKQVMKDWLKSLKDRVQPKQEWSDVDEDMRYKATAVINRLCAEGKEYVWSVNTLKKLFYWLKSLKPQNKWKPSDEQMDMLAKMCSTLHLTYGENEIMESIYDALKKLKV